MDRHGRQEWFCIVCGVIGKIEGAEVIGMTRLRELMREQHREASPECAGVKSGRVGSVGSVFAPRPNLPGMEGNATGESREAPQKTLFGERV
jgi:hypothetical protein